MKYSHSQNSTYWISTWDLIQINGIHLLKIPAPLTTHQTKHLPGSDLLLHSVNFCTAEPYLCLWWAERRDVQSSPEHPPACYSPCKQLCPSPREQGRCRPALARLGQAGCSPSQSSHLHSKSSLSLQLQRKPSVQNLVYTLFWCIDVTPPFTVKQFWLIKSGRWMNTLLSVNHKSTLDKKYQTEWACFLLWQYYQRLAAWAETELQQQKLYLYIFSKLCFSNINVKKLRIMGFKAPEFHSTCSLSWFLN